MCFVSVSFCRGLYGRCRSLADIAGVALEFCGDQWGSRFVQEALQRASAEVWRRDGQPVRVTVGRCCMGVDRCAACEQERQAVFVELEPHLLPMLKDIYGAQVLSVSCFEQLSFDRIAHR